MKKIKSAISFLLTIIILSGLYSCEKVVGEGPVVTQLRQIEGFKALSVSIGGQINFQVAPQFKVELQAQQNVLDVLETRIIGEELTLKIRDGKRLSSSAQVIVNISGPFLKDLHLSGSGNVDVSGNLSTEELDLTVSGSGNIHLQQAALDRLKANISGSGGIFIAAGATRYEQLRISGSGSIDASALMGESGVVDISGSGNARVHLTKSLDASISGSGSVFYRGNPTLSTRISGSGTVRPL